MGCFDGRLRTWRFECLHACETRSTADMYMPVRCIALAFSGFFVDMRPTGPDNFERIEHFGELGWHFNPLDMPALIDA